MSLCTVHFRVDVRITGKFCKVELGVWKLFAVWTAGCQWYCCTTCVKCLLTIVRTSTHNSCACFSSVNL